MVMRWLVVASLVMAVDAYIFSGLYFAKLPHTPSHEKKPEIGYLQGEPNAPFEGDERVSAHLQLKDIPCSFSDSEQCSSDLNETVILGEIPFVEVFNITSNLSLVASFGELNKLERFFHYIYNSSEIIITDDTSLLYRHSKVQFNDTEVNSRLQEMWLQGRFLSQKRSFKEEWESFNPSKIYNSSPNRPSVESIIMPNMQRAQVLSRDTDRIKELFSFLQLFASKNSSLWGRPLMEYQYVAPPERSLNASLLIIRDFAFWFRSLFPYYYSECLHCGYSKPSNTSEKENIFLGVVCANATEKQGLAARTELFHCAHCGEVSRFARYNDVGHIVANRRGRCGEYSVLMMQLLRCLGYPHVRWIVDRDDHLWCEVGFPLVSVSNSNHIEGSNHTIEWFHVDPCEAAVNEPYIYESWGKRPSFVFAISAASVTDVTKQYSRNHSQIYSIRVAENITEMHLQSLLHRANELSVDSPQSFS